MPKLKAKKTKFSKGRLIAAIILLISLVKSTSNGQPGWTLAFGGILALLFWLPGSRAWINRHPLHLGLTLSVVMNLVLISGLVLFFFTPYLNYAIQNKMISKLCYDDYDWMISQLGKGSEDPEKVKAFYAASTCLLDYKTRKPLDSADYKNGVYRADPEAQGVN